MDHVWPHLEVGARIRCPEFVDATATIVETDVNGGVRIDDQNLTLIGPDEAELDIVYRPRGRRKQETVTQRLRRHDDTRGTALFEVTGVESVNGRCLVRARRGEGAPETVRFFEDQVRITLA